MLPLQRMADGKGVYRSTDGGFSWLQSSGGSWIQAADVIGFAELPDGRIIAATVGYGIFSSSDGGSTWAEAMGGIPNAAASFRCISSTLYGYVLVGSADSGGLYRSTGRMSAWGTNTFQSRDAVIRIVRQPILGNGELEFSLHHPCHVKMEIVDALGYSVCLLADNLYYEGTHRVSIRAPELPSGAYYCRLSTGKAITVSKLVVLSGFER